MEIAYNNNEAKVFVQEVSIIRKLFNSQTLLIRNKTGHIVSNKEKVLQKLSEYYQKHFELQDGRESDDDKEWTKCVQTAEPYFEPQNNGSQ